MRKNKKLEKLKKIILPAIVCTLLLNIVYELYVKTILNIHHFSFDNMVYSEMLLNYTNGIIKRGLVGEFVHFIKLTYNLKSSVEIINLIIFITNSIILILLSYLFLKNRKLKLYIIYLIAPGSLFLIYTDEIHLYGRIDIFSYLFILIQFAFQISKSPVLSTLKFQIPFLSVSYFILPFVHEGFIFLYFPTSFLLFYLYNSEKKLKSIITPAILLISSYFLVIMITIFVKVNYDQLYSNLSFIDKSIICNNCQGQINSLDYGYYFAMKSNSIKQSLIEFIYQIANFNIWYWINIILVIYLYIYLTCEYLNLGVIRNSILSYFLLITLPVLLLCIIAIDYGRFFGIIVMNSFLFFLIPHEILNKVEVKLRESDFLKPFNLPIINIKINNKLFLITLLLIIGLGTPVAYTTGAKSITYKNNFILILKDYFIPKKYFTEN